MKNLIFILLTTLVFGQKAKLQPTIGIHWTESLSYNMEHSVPSGQLGLVYTLKKPTMLFHNVGISGNYYYDFLSERVDNVHDFYVLRLQFAKQVIPYWNLTYYGGYINDFKNNLMSHYEGRYKSKAAYGIGVQTFDEYVTAEALYENFGGYSQISIGVNVNIINLLKEKK